MLSMCSGEPDHPTSEVGGSQVVDG